MEKLATIIGLGMLGIFVVVLFSFIFALPVMWLWNWLVPSIFGLREIGWLEAWGLNMLCGFLFKGTYSAKSSD